MTKVIVKTLFATAVSMASFTCLAGFKSFEAPVEESKWDFNGNPLNCSLRHKIPFYGDAEFKKISGKSAKLGFSLGYSRHQVSADKVASVRAISPSWQPRQASREMGEVSLKAGRHIIKSEETASWRLLNELEIGRFPTFFYQDFNDIEDQVSVALSSVGFQLAYDKFLSCLASLVPYKLNELKKMTLYFDFDKSSIRHSYHTKLQALAAYVKYDPTLDVVFISGHTDSKGSRSYNKKLSERRIKSVKDILSLDGIGDERFKTLAFGEKKPVSTNRNAKGRALNRRVYIRIAQK